MKSRYLTRIVTLLILAFTCQAAIAESSKQKENIASARAVLQEIIDVNVQYQTDFNTKVPASSLTQQTPSTTAVLCSDSRVDTQAIHDDPVGNLFIVRNIGNQVQTAYGSVEYGVYHLHTHVLLVVGHSQCGAIKAVMADYSGESERIRSELDSLVVDHHASLNDNIVHNVNNQVMLAVQDFKDKVNSDDVVVIGMVYDLHNDFKMGNGQLIVVNVNNETDPVALSKNKYLQGLNNVQFLGNMPISAPKAVP